MPTLYTFRLLCLVLYEVPGVLLLYLKIEHSVFIGAIVAMLIIY